VPLLRLPPREPTWKLSTEEGVVIRRATINGIRFFRGPGQKGRPGSWRCEACGWRLQDGTLRAHVAERHTEVLERAS
jgi:hypothetical protein